MRTLIFLCILVQAKGLKNCLSITDNSKDFCAKTDYLKHRNPDYPKPTTVYLDIIIRNVLDIDEENHLVEIVAYSNVKWMEPRLDIKSISDNQIARYTDDEMNDVWNTDITYANAISADKRFKYFTATKRNRTIWFKRNILYKFKVTCEMDFSYFPFDSHVCFWKLRSYYQNTDSEIVKINRLQIETKQDIATKYKSISDTTKIIPFDFKVSLGDEGIESVEGENKSVAFVQFNFKRKYEGRYQLISAYFLPTGLFATLSMVSYLIKPEIVSFNNFSLDACNHAKYILIQF